MEDFKGNRTSLGFFWVGSVPTSSLFVGGFGGSTQKQYDFAGDIPGQQQDRSLGSGGSAGVRIWQWSGDQALLSDNASCQIHRSAFRVLHLC